MTKKAKKPHKQNPRHSSPSLKKGFVKFLRRINPLPIAIVATVIFAVTFFFKFPHIEDRMKSVSFKTETTNSASLELGEQQIKRTGTAGESVVTYSSPRSLFDLLFQKNTIVKKKISSKVTKEPVSEVVARGTKKYQYMWCSSGSYRYYTSTQFKDPTTGFTHKSKDYCAANNEGHTTQLADTPPTTQTTSTPTVTPFYFPESTYTPITITPYAGATPLYTPPPLQTYSPPTSLPITVSPKPKPPTETCTYYQGNGVCF